MVLLDCTFLSELILVYNILYFIEYSIMSEANKFNLMLCELHYIPIHGKTNESWPSIETHYLVIDCFDIKTGRSILDSESEEDEDEE